MESPTSEPKPPATEPPPTLDPAELHRFLDWLRDNDWTLCRKSFGDLRPMRIFKVTQGDLVDGYLDS